MSKNMQLLLIGGAGISVGTALSLVFPNAGVLPGTAMMLILCISAALCGASVPGVIQLNSKPIRATGAAVFFALPWLIQPSSLDDDPDDPQHTASATETGAGAAHPAPDPGAGAGARTPNPAAPRPAGGRPRPGARPADDATKSPSKPALTRPRTIFDGLFSKSSAK